MADNIDNLMLEHLKRFQASLDRVERKLGDHTQRLGRIETILADHTLSWAEQSVRIDRMADRLDRMERRLELTV